MLIAVLLGVSCNKYTYFIIHIYTFNGLGTIYNINGQTKNLNQLIFYKHRCNSSDSLFKKKNKKKTGRPSSTIEVNV